MKVIMIKDVNGTGKTGEVVKVSDGFANNRLLPAGLAVPATDKNIREIEKEKALRKEKEAEEKAAAKALEAELESQVITVITRAGEGGKLFGSITSMDIATAIKEQTGKDIDKKKISLDRPIKQMGAETVEVKLYTEISAKVRINVVGE